MAENAATVHQKVTLGAGKWYVTPWEAGAIKLDEVIKDENLMGYTQGGATISFTPTMKTIEDDTGNVRKVFKTAANAEMKTGLLTFTLESLNKIMSFGRLENGSEGSGTKILKLSAGKEELKKFCVAFEYKDDEGNYMRIGMVASNTSTLELAFTKDTETVVDMTFAAESNGVDNVIVVFEEGKTTAAAAEQNAEQGET